jgi:Phage late-transcription coactivator
MIELDNRVTVNNFQTTIESWVHKKGMGYLEAIMFYCEQHNIEIEAVASLIRKSEAIKAKLEAECEDQNMILKQPKLPI